MRCSFKRSRGMRRAAQSNVANPRQEGPDRKAQQRATFPLTFEGHGVAGIVKSTVAVKQAFRNGRHKS